MRKKKLKLVYAGCYYGSNRKSYWSYHFKYGKDVINVTEERKNGSVCATSSIWNEYKTFDNLEAFKKAVEGGNVL